MNTQPLIVFLNYFSRFFIAGEVTYLKYDGKSWYEKGINSFGISASPSVVIYLGILHIINEGAGVYRAL